MLHYPPLQRGGSERCSGPVLLTFFQQGGDFEFAHPASTENPFIRCSFLFFTTSGYRGNYPLSRNYPYGTIARQSPKEDKMGRHRNQIEQIERQIGEVNHDIDLL